MGIVNPKNPRNSDVYLWCNTYFRFTPGDDTRLGWGLHYLKSVHAVAAPVSGGDPQSLNLQGIAGPTTHSCPLFFAHLLDCCQDQLRDQ
ncbi:MAG: hypothetical protein CM1200mP41_15990 [Gammaproteobacteria bacterium]|nr:MAG: hypothetical protein CM1200mP41_15990 [Gammaproteobacteria bacterium]